MCCNWFKQNITTSTLSDFEIYGVSNKELADYIADNLDFDQLILEYLNQKNQIVMEPIVLIKVADQNRKEYLRAVKGADGRTSYQKEHSDSKLTLVQMTLLIH